MKKLFFALMPAGLLFSGVALAQKEKKEAKEHKEVVIEKTINDKKEKTVIVVDDGKVTINGKPASEYKGNKHIVIDGDVVIADGETITVPGRKTRVRTINRVGNKAMLGVRAESNDKGAEIAEVVKESAAEKAGLQKGDIITSINDKAVASQQDLVAVVGGLKPEDKVEVNYLRDGKKKTAKAILGKNNTTTTYNYNYNWDNNFDIDGPMAMVSPRAPRAPLAPLPPTGAIEWSNDRDLWVFRSDRPKYGMSIEDNADGDGVKITDLEEGSNALKAGLQKGDIVTAVDDKPVKGTDELRAALRDTQDKTSINVQVLRSGKTETISVRVPKIIKKAEL